MSPKAVAPESPGATILASTKRVGGARRRVGAAARRAALAVLTGLAAFAALQIMAAAALELWAPGIIDPDYGARLQAIRAGRNTSTQRPATIVMLGSSRAYYGFVTRELGASLSEELGRPVRLVNAAQAGSGPVTELLTWKRLQRDGVRPHLLLVEVLPGLLSDAHARYELSEARMPEQRLFCLDLPLIERYAAGARPDLWGRAACTRAATLYERRLGILLTLAPSLLDPGTSTLVVGPEPGVLAADMPPEQRAKALEFAHLQYSEAVKHIDPDSRNGRALCELLASCRETGVPAILVVMPEGPVFRSWYPPDAWPRIEGWLGRISREYDAPLVNALEWIDEEDFMDSHHLFPRGADEFSRRLGRECLLPWLRRQPNRGDPPTGQPLGPTAVMREVGE